MFAVDATGWSCVIVCECGWRTGAPDRHGAWVLARQHEAVAHPGQWQAAARVAATRRERETNGASPS